MNDKITGLLSVKPGNEPEQGETRTFVIEQRPARNGKKAWTKIKGAGLEYGGAPYRILSAEPTGYVDAHGNCSFNVEIEPSNEAPTGFQQAKSTMEAPADAPESPPAHQNGESNSEIAKYAAHAGRVFGIAWLEATEAMAMIPVKDAEELSVAEWLDLKLRIAQGFAIEVNKIIRKERF